MRVTLEDSQSSKHVALYNSLHPGACTSIIDNLLNSDNILEKISKICVEKDIEQVFDFGWSLGRF